MEDEDEYWTLSDSELREVLKLYKSKPSVRRIVDSNRSLLYQVLDLQEFMEHHGLLEEDYLAWQQNKKERVYH
jgi:hypothetical protein|tara:strand:- start:34 stop:252 length:219 start_codon:yes stop_codon:yes gene_type:complete